MKIRIFSHAAVLQVLALVVPSAVCAAGETNVFTAGTGDFHDPAAWSLAAVPGAGDTASVTNPSVITAPCRRISRRRSGSPPKP